MIDTINNKNVKAMFHEAVYRQKAAGGKMGTRGTAPHVHRVINRFI